MLAAKYAIENDLIPIVYEKSDKPGGLWAPNNTAIWDSLHVNVSYFMMNFSDHPYPADCSLYPNKSEIYDYLMSYMKRFDLEKHISFNTKVEQVRQLEDKRWLVKCVQDGHELVNTFDFVVVSSGLHSLPHLPTVKDEQAFEGLILHSSQFKPDDERFKSKKVLVLGHSFSGADISQHLVDHAASVVNVFERPYLVTRHLVKTPTSKPNVFNILPSDFYFFNRAATYKSVEEKHEFVLNKMLTINAEQLDKEKCPPALFYELDANETDVRITFADNYYSFVKQGKIVAKKANLKRFASNGVYLSDDSFQECDVVIYCTGYNLAIDYLDQRTKELMEYDANNYKFPHLLYKFTFHPDIENMALICQNDALFFTASELQAKWAAMVFSGKLDLPSVESMRKEMNLLREKRKKHLRLQYEYGSHTELIDSLAKEMGVLPDLAQIKQTDEKLYEQLWNNCSLSAHYALDSNRTHALTVMQQVAHVYAQEYTFDSSDEETNNSIGQIAARFAEKNPNLKMSMEMFRT